MVLLEIADELLRRGHEVTVHANHVSPMLRAEPTIGAVRLSEQPPSVCEFDWVWAQHQTFPLLLPETGPVGPLPPVFFVHLSPYEPLEAPMPEVENAAASLVLANSEETAGALRAAGIASELIRIFPNPAPAEFLSASRQHPAKLGRVIAVSNHLPDEIHELLRRLRDDHGLVVEHWGVGGEPRRVTPDVLAEASAVISIGKTVQYCLLAGIPVFCYDHFGGPGWLSPESLESAAALNFSGRGQPGRRSSDALLDEFLRGYDAAAAFATSVPEEIRSRYNLATHLDALLDPAWNHSSRCAKRSRRLAARAGTLWASRQLARVIARESAGRQESGLLVERVAGQLRSVQELAGSQAEEAAVYAESLRKALAIKDAELERLLEETERQDRGAILYAESLREVLAAKEAELASLRDASERQGREAALYAESLRETLAAKEAELASLRDASERQGREAALYTESLREALAAKEAELARFRDETAQLTRELADLSSLRASLEGLLKQYRSNTAIRLVARLRGIDHEKGGDPAVQSG
jgi:hypothetical protein